MSEKTACDYNIDYWQGICLSACATLPAEYRRELLSQYAHKHGAEALLTMFAEFIGLANSVVANNREAIELFLITDKQWHPYDAEKVNLPTIMGALNGLKLVEGINQEKTCHGCAFRKGTPANQCLPTTFDAAYCADEGEKFLCHEDLDQNGQPFKTCRGYGQAKAKAGIA
jgi:hypothetical protein